MTTSLVVGHDVESNFLRAAIGEKAKYCKIGSARKEGMVGRSLTVVLSEDMRKDFAYPLE